WTSTTQCGSLEDLGTVIRQTQSSSTTYGSPQQPLFQFGGHSLAREHLSMDNTLAGLNGLVPDLVTNLLWTTCYQGLHICLVDPVLGRRGSPEHYRIYG